MIGYLEAMRPLLDGAGRRLTGIIKGGADATRSRLSRACDHLWDEGEAQRRVCPAEDFVVELLDAHIFGGVFEMNEWVWHEWTMITTEDTALKESR